MVKPTPETLCRTCPVLHIAKAFNLDYGDLLSYVQYRQYASENRSLKTLPPNIEEQARQSFQEFDALLTLEEEIDCQELLDEVVRRRKS